MQLHLDGSNVIRADRQTVYGRLTDPNFLATALPDAEDVRVVGDDQIEAKLKVRIAVVSSTLNVKMSIAEKSPPSRAKLVAVGNGSGSSMTISSIFDLTGEMPTTVNWSADADITGVMAGLGSTLLKGFAAKKVGEIFGGITAAIERAGT